MMAANPFDQFDVASSGTASPPPPAYSRDAAIGYIREAATKRGIDPNVALRVADSEGLNEYTGDAGTSFGPFQLHYGHGAKTGFGQSGLGNEFTDKTGLDARDPLTWQRQVDFALDTAKEKGWGDWYGARKVGITGMHGIAPGDQTMAPLQYASADGAFELPAASQPARAATDIAPQQSIGGPVASGGITIAPKGGQPVNVGPQAAANPFDQFDAPGTAQASADVSIPQDVARSFGSGVQEGVAGISGLPGDMQGWALAGARGVLDWLGFTPERLAEMGIPQDRIALLNDPAFSLVPTSSQYLEATETVTGPRHEPQTMAGEYAQTIGQFAPAAFTGPETLAGKAIAVGVPALASETAGQLTRNVAPEYEGAARFGGALAGGAVTGRAGVPRAPRVEAPDSGDLRQMKNLAYDRFTEAAERVRVSPQSYDRFVAGLIHKMNRERINDASHPETAALLKQLVAESRGGQNVATGRIGAQGPQPMTLVDMEKLRGLAVDATRAARPGDQRLARIVKDRIDDYLDKFAGKDLPEDMLADSRVAVASVKEARSLVSRLKKSEVLDEILDRAGVDKFNMTQSGWVNAVQKEFRSLAKNKNRLRQFSKEEQAAIRKVASGGWSGWAANQLGKLAPRGIVSASMTPIALTSLFGPALGGLLTPIFYGAGITGQRLATGVATRNIGEASNLIRAGQAAAPVPAVRALPGVPAEAGALDMRLRDQ